MIATKEIIFNAFLSIAIPANIEPINTTPRNDKRDINIVLDISLLLIITSVDVG